MKNYKIGKRFEEMEYEEMASSQAIDSVDAHTVLITVTIFPPTITWCPTLLSIK